MIGIDKIRKSVLMCLGMLLVTTGIAEAQETRVITTIEPSSIVIGEQAKMTVSIVYPVGTRAEIVLPKDTLVTGVEILSVSMVDSVTETDKLNRIVYDVVLTSFDSATYVLRNIQAMVGSTLVQEETPPSLIVNTVPVDIDHPNQYADIKGTWKPDFVWTDYLLYLYILLGLIAVGVLTYFLVKYLRQPKEKRSAVAPEPALDPYEEAIMGMRQLKSEELWEKNQIKEYYTRMTDILRHYLWRVYGMETAERTSTEILETFNTLVGRDRMYIELKKILQTADLAKFAQYRASSDENVSLMSAAVAFIEENKPQEKEEEKSEDSIRVEDRKEDKA